LISKLGKKIKIINRRGKNITYRYPELKEIWKNILAKQALIDGELVVLNRKNLPDFHLLQQREQVDKKLEIEVKSKEIPATIFVFDILELNKEKVVNLPLLERKNILRKVVIDSEKIVFLPFSENGTKLWKIVNKLEIEGVIAKEKNSKYERGRSENWLKIKNTKTIDAFILGYTTEKRKISALCLGCFNKHKKIIYIGRVAAGLDKERIEKLIKKLKVISNPGININTRKKITFVKPEIVVEVKFLEFTKKGELRSPVLLKIREDKKIEDCILEEQLS